MGSPAAIFRLAPLTLSPTAELDVAQAARTALCIPTAADDIDLVVAVVHGASDLNSAA